MQFTEQQISAVARLLSDRAAEDCGLDKDDKWKIYGEAYINSARHSLNRMAAAAPQVVADERGLPPLPETDVEGGYYDSESGFTKKAMQEYAIAYGQACHAMGRGVAVREYAENGTFAAPAAQGDTTQAEIDVLAERRRQINVEGRTTDSDDRHTDCELARAAATYALCTEPEQLKLQGVAVWPWNRYWWKFTDYRRNLVKSGALIIAEIERIDRAAIAAKAAS